MTKLNREVDGEQRDLVHKHYNELPDKDDLTAVSRIGLTVTNILPMANAA